MKMMSPVMLLVITMLMMRTCDAMMVQMPVMMLRGADGVWTL